MPTIPTVERRPTTTIAVVAPEWLQEALEVLLDGISGVMLIGSASDVDALLEIQESPDFVLLDADRQSSIATSQVERINHAWPDSDCIALVDNARQISLLKEVGVSLSLLKGTSPQRITELLQKLVGHRLEGQIAFRPSTPRL